MGLTILTDAQWAWYIAYTWTPSNFTKSFQVPKMEDVLNLKAILVVFFFVFSLHKPYLYSLLRWGFLRFRYIPDIFWGNADLIWFTQVIGPGSSYK